MTQSPTDPAVHALAKRSAVMTLLVVAAALIAVALLLWVRFGTTVFFEMVASGIAACF